MMNRVLLFHFASPEVDNDDECLVFPHNQSKSKLGENIEHIHNAFHFLSESDNSIRNVNYSFAVSRSHSKGIPKDHQKWNSNHDLNPVPDEIQSENLQLLKSFWSW